MVIQKKTVTLFSFFDEECSDGGEPIVISSAGFFGNNTFLSWWLKNRWTWIIQKAVFFGSSFPC